MNCTCCQTPLSGGVDTYGDLDFPMCQSCHLALCEEERAEWPQMFTCTVYPDGSIGCTMTPEWKALEDALEATR